MRSLAALVILVSVITAGVMGWQGDALHAILSGVAAVALAVGLIILRSAEKIAANAKKRKSQD